MKALDILGIGVAICMSLPTAVPGQDAAAEVRPFKVHVSDSALAGVYRLTRKIADVNKGFIDYSTS